MISVTCLDHSYPYIASYINIQQLDRIYHLFDDWYDENVSTFVSSVDEMKLIIQLYWFSDPFEIMTNQILITFLQTDLLNDEMIFLGENDDMWCFEYMKANEKQFYQLKRSDAEVLFNTDFLAKIQMLIQNPTSTNVLSIKFFRELNSKYMNKIDH
jgi:hypothetical protein